MNSSVEFGLFDWIDRGKGNTAELYEERLKLIEYADEVGFYGYHLAEHHGTVLGMAPSPSLFFAALAQRTKQIRFSPMAYLLPMYHPIRLIEEVCMLDHLSHGRMELGVSRGVSPHEISCYGVNPDETREIFAEALEIFRIGMCEETLNFSGQHFQFNDVPMAIKPFQAPYPPLWYPTFSESGTTYAAEHGFNFMTLGPPGLTVQLAAHYREVSAQHADDVQRINGHVKNPKIGAMRQIFVAETEAEALKIGKAAYADWYDSILQLWRRKSDTSYDEFFKWEACYESETILVGSVEKVRDQIQQVVSDGGLNYFVGSFAWGSLTPQQSRRSLELFVSDIMPKIS